MRPYYVVDTDRRRPVTEIMSRFHSYPPLPPTKEFVPMKFNAYAPTKSMVQHRATTTCSHDIPLSQSCDICEREVGALKDMPAETYHSMPALSSTILKEFGSRSPFHAMEMKRNPRKPTDAMIIGTAIHTAILEPHLFESQFAQSPECDRRTKAGKEIYAEFQAQAEGKTILSPDDYDMVRTIGDKIHADRELREELSQGQAEGSAFWTDPTTGVLCKCRPDYYRPGDSVIIDVKTTENASLEAFGRVAANLRYHWQAQFYVRGISQAMNRPVTAFKFLVIEKKPPFGFALYTLADEWLDKADADITRAMRDYAVCLQKNEWPSYPKRGVLRLPSWAMGGSVDE